MTEQQATTHKILKSLARQRGLEIERLRVLNKELLATLEAARDTLRDMTTEEFQKGEDREIRERIETTIELANQERA